ncbi:hypothetical protein OR1_00955 [Geobacter sp. OR-1]|nr:hypothetical protein OR1_00955 [Geobacter sp. OR-1]
MKVQITLLGRNKLIVTNNNAVANNGSGVLSYMGNACCCLICYYLPTEAHRIFCMNKE